MGLKQLALEAAREYLRAHPEEIGRALRNVLGLRVGIPLAALRWLGRQAQESGKVQQLRIAAKPPGISVTADVDLMDTPVRAGATIYIERIIMNAEELALTIRVEDVELELTGDAQTAVAALIKSGALDLTNPATLAGYLPGRSPVLVEANGNRLTLDLLKDPKLSKDPRVRHAVGLITSFVAVHGVETDPDHLDVVFRAFPRGVFAAAGAFGRHIVRPGLSRFLPAPR